MPNRCTAVYDIMRKDFTGLKKFLAAIILCYVMTIAWYQIPHSDQQSHSANGLQQA